MNRNRASGRTDNDWLEKLAFYLLLSDDSARFVAIGGITPSSWRFAELRAD